MNYNVGNSNLHLHRVDHGYISTSYLHVNVYTYTVHYTCTYKLSANLTECELVLANSLVTLGSILYCISIIGVNIIISDVLLWIQVKESLAL